MKKFVIQNVDRVVRRKDYEHLTDNKLVVTSVFRTLQGEGPYAGHPAVFLRLAGCNFGDKDDHCQFCFPSDTDIVTVDGKTTVGSVQKGSKLFALNEKGEVVETTVRKVMKRNVGQDELVQVKYRLPGEKTIRRLVATKEHPFHTTKRGFVPAGELTTGDKIYHVAANQLQKQVVAKKMRENNPSHNPDIHARGRVTFAERHARGEYDMSRSDEQKARYSVSKMGDKNPMKRHEVRLKNMQAHVYEKSNLEVKFEEVFALANINAKYSGNTGRTVIGNDIDGYAMPDFVLPGSKKVIEVYDTTFKYVTAGKAKRRTKKNYEEPRRAFYESQGYEVLFLTQKDLPKCGKGNTLAAEHCASLKEKIGMFKRNGAEIVSVEPLTNKHWGMLHRGKGTVEVTNFSCHPYNTFIIGNLHTHNCDTSFQLDQGKTYSFEELTMAIYALEGYSKSDILVITGGEPTLQPALLNWIESVTDMFKRVQIETNGTQVAFFKELSELETARTDSGWIDYVRPSVVVSPKASMKAQRYAEPSELVKQYASCFKFVVTADETDPHHTVPQWALDLMWLGRCAVYVSPMAVYKKPYQGEVSSAWDHELIDPVETAKNYAYAAKYALENNLLLSIQQHLFLGVA